MERNGVVEGRRLRRSLLGFVAGLATAGLVAVPVFWSAAFAVAAFTGCFIACDEPEPVRGVLWAGAAVVLLAAPVAAGVAVAGGNRRTTVMAAGGVVLLAVAWIALDMSGAM